MGGPLYRGIVLKALLDTVDVTNCQFNYSCYVREYCAIRTTKCIDLLMARGDGMSFSNILSRGVRNANGGLSYWRNLLSGL